MVSRRTLPEWFVYTTLADFLFLAQYEYQSKTTHIVWTLLVLDIFKHFPHRDTVAATLQLPKFGV